MKAGIIIPWVSRKGGGTLDAVRGLARSIQQSPEFCLEVFSTEDKFTRSDRVAWYPLPVHTFEIRGPRGFGYAPDLGPALRASGLDLLHAHGSWMYPSVASLLWARHCKKPYLISSHGMLDPWALRNSRLKKCIAGWLYEDRHLRGAMCLHALCASEARAMRAYGLINPICVIPNGVDLPESSTPHLPPWHGVLPEGAKVLLYFGRLHHKKGIRNLLQAWHLIHKHNVQAVDEWHLVIAAWDEAQYETELKLLTQQLCLDNKVHFVGAQFSINKQATYCHAQALLLPSFSEGLPMVVLEAWSYGLPVLMTPFCNLPEGFELGAAIEVQTDPQSIREGIATLCAMTDTERTQMGMRGRKLVEQQFAWPRIAAEMRAVYEWILGGGQPPPCIMIS